MKGLVLYFNEEKGWGRILGEDGKKYHAHFSKIVGRDSKILWERETVNFDSINPRKDGQLDQAINIRPEDLTEYEYYQIYKNPFDPYNPINKPEKFAGRRRPLKDAVTSLLNNNSILITGDRGIGKTSFANQIVYIAEGDDYLLKKINIELENIKKFDYAVISINGYEGIELRDIAGNIIREYIKNYDLEKKKEIEHEINLKIYKTKIRSISKKDYENFIDIFNYDMTKIHDVLCNKNGLLILIDEVENIDPESNFASFVKNVSEYFNRERKKISFIISGIPCATTRLFLQHPSFFRLLNHIELKELSAIESYELLDIFMKKQKKRINNMTKARICQLARGYPVNLQLLGFYTYQIDSNNNITKDDLDVALDFIVDKVKKEEFLNRHESIGFGLPEMILKHTFKYKFSDNITFEKIKESFSEYDPDSIQEALELLVNKELIQKAKKGEYYIKDQLFLFYLKKHYGYYEK